MQVPFPIATGIAQDRSIQDDHEVSQKHKPQRSFSPGESLSFFLVEAICNSDHSQGDNAGQKHQYQTVLKLPKDIFQKFRHYFFLLMRDIIPLPQRSCNPPGMKVLLRFT